MLNRDEDGYSFEVNRANLPLDNNNISYLRVDRGHGTEESALGMVIYPGDGPSGNVVFLNKEQALQLAEVILMNVVNLD